MEVVEEGVVEREGEPNVEEAGEIGWESCSSTSEVDRKVVTEAGDGTRKRRNVSRCIERVSRKRKGRRFERADLLLFQL